MGVFHSCFAKSNKVGVMREEEEVYDKVCRTLVTEDVTEKKGGLAFGLSFISEEEPKMPPPKLLASKKEDFEKWRSDQEKAQCQKQKLAEQRREEARVQRQIEVAHRDGETGEIRQHQCRIIYVMMIYIFTLSFYNKYHNCYQLHCCLLLLDIHCNSKALASSVPLMWQW